MLLKLRQITKVVGNDKLQHAIDRFLPGVSHNFSKGVEKSLLKWEIYLRAEQVIALFSQHLAHSGVGNHLPLYYLSVALAVPDLHVTLLSRCASGYNR